jgi:hypothetical protein
MDKIVALNHVGVHSAGFPDIASVFIEEADVLQSVGADAADQSS